MAGIKPFAPGQAIKADHLNRVRKGAEAGLRAFHAPKQVPVEDPLPSLEAGNSVAFGVFAVTTEANDTVSDGSTTIAKPSNLRGFIRERTVNSEDQVILPAYISGGSAPVVATVVAAKVGDTISGVSGVEWLDLNVAGRMLAEDT